MGHYFTSSLYDSNSSLETIGRKEFKPRKWAFKVLAPYKKLKELYEEGCRYTCEFAVELGVTEDLIERAYNYYKEIMAKKTNSTINGKDYYRIRKVIGHTASGEKILKNFYGKAKKKQSKKPMSILMILKMD